MKRSDSTGPQHNEGGLPESEVPDRTREWFVPSFGPRKVRSAIGLLFLPYTAMVVSYSVAGSMLAHVIAWDRVAAIGIIYALGLGVGAHALDGLGGGHRPWGKVFARGELWLVASGSLIAAYAIAGYYIIAERIPLLIVVAVAEGFFVFSYNLEWFHGWFHKDAWFAFSWGFLPVLAGYIMQTNRVSAPVIVLAASMALLSLVEIKASRPYKELKRRMGGFSRSEAVLMSRYEAILKSVSFGVILLGGAIVLWRLLNLE